MAYRASTPLMIFAGEEYGTGFGRATGRQGHHAARREGGHRQELERIHRANLAAWVCCPASSKTASTPPP